MKTKIIWIYCMVCVMFITGCNKHHTNQRKDMQYIYGGEMYNASYVYYEGKSIIHSISILSNRKLEKVKKMELEYDGGSFEYNFEIINGNKKVDEYELYTIDIELSNIIFDSDIININIIRLIDEEETYCINLDKCQIKNLKVDLNGDKVDINGTPLEIPFDMNSFPVEVSSKEDIEITNIIFTNDEFKISEYNNPTGETSKEFLKTKLNPSGEEQCFDMKLDMDVSGENKYKQYSTSFIIEYEFQGKTYYEIPAVTTSIFNPFADNIEDYYENIKNK